jgi:ABC-type branched-subunit amino acid transport system ATPase component
MGIGVLEMGKQLLLKYVEGKPYIANGRIIWNGNLYLDNTDISELPEHLTVDGYLSIENTKIKKLPDDIIVNDNLYIGKKVKIPESAVIKKDIIY